MSFTKSNLTFLTGSQYETTTLTNINTQRLGRVFAVANEDRDGEAAVARHIVNDSGTAYGAGVCVIQKSGAARGYTTLAGATTDPQKVLGVVPTKSDNSHTIADDAASYVICDGPAKAKSGAAITIGDYLKVDSTGRVVTAAAADSSFAIAEEAATGANEYIKILILD